MTVRNIIMGLVLGSMAVATAVGGYVWLNRPTSTPRPAHVAIVMDRSTSLQADPECQSLIGIIDEVIAQNGNAPGSKLVVFMTGDPETGFEPLPLGVEEIPYSSSVLEGAELIEHERNRLKLELTSLCMKTPAIDESAITVSIRRALEQLAGMGCAKTGACTLRVRTDGRETQQKWIKESLEKGIIADPTPEDLLNNQGVTVYLCGFAEFQAISPKRASKISSTHATLLTHIWKQAFTHPEHVIIQPVCPRGHWNAGR